ncbi:MAG: peptidase S41 [Nitrospinaceae bacterium]|nr:MAG: peptidase S41 [Nitrospinaceae bacterium]
MVPDAHAGFFNNDLELFDEVIDLIAEKYVYPPNFKKLFSVAIEEMLTAAGQDNLVFRKTSSGQVIQGRNYEVQYDLNYDQSHDMASFKKVYYFLLDESRGRYSKQDLETAAVVGIMNSLDPYSQYLDKSAFDKSMRDTEGKYGGLGMIVTQKDDQLMVIKTMKNGPAQRAGILAQDIFTKVNGQIVRGMEIHELAETLRGYPNTKVTLSLVRPSENKDRTYTLTREIISIETVNYQTLDDGIGYLKISSFSKQTNDQLKEGLAQAKADGVKAFILDLRDNPGGLLNQSVKIASHFLYRGRMIVYTQGRRKSDYKEYRAQYKNSLLHMPVVILVNRHSASASEIVAGALRDSGKALIIGENSYGKGSVQTIFRISDGSGLRLTTSKYFTPSGIDITEHGIVPEIKIVKEVDLGETLGTESVILGKKGTQTASIQLQESDLRKYFKENEGKKVENDASLQFAHMLLKNLTIANKKQTLDKARQIAANIHY